MVSSLLLAGSLVSLTQAVSLPLSARGTNSTKAFSWVDTRPTKDLQYYDCGNGFQCARLEVPLDWANPTKNSTAAIGIVKLPAAVPDDDPSFAGSVLINPGGPSGSGTAFAYSWGPGLQKVIGENYEIIGFDPRGVNTTTPHADCFKGDQFARRLSQERTSNLPPIDDALGYHWASASAQSALCEENGADSIWGHMNTASVARDMVEIIDRIDDLRWKESGKAKPKDAEAARLNYIGISYGTFLGNTFASMFPERIERMWIDAVVDADDFSAGTFRNDINDAEKIVDQFYELCFESGEDCPLIESSDKSGADIKARVADVIDNMDTTPVSFSFNDRPYMLTSPIIRQAIFSMLYGPLTSFETLALGLGALMNGNYSILTAFLPSDSIKLVCDASDDDELPQYNWDTDVLAGVLCSDIVDEVVDRNISFYEEVVAYLKNQSETTGTGVSGAIPIACAGRKLRPSYPFTGPYTSPAANGNDTNAPAAPLLITSSRYDPITPLRNAFHVSEGHPGSAVVIQETSGHGATSNPSECLVKIVREYFSEGKLPESGTVCESTCHPTIPADKENCTSILNSRDVEYMLPALGEFHWF
ncbi:putative hydrolase [Colletotrichum sp. SAR11_240]|nr:putative hydrolase [Colletotrichum sp. SAR11_240]